MTSERGMLAVMSEERMVLVPCKPSEPISAMGCVSPDPIGDYTFLVFPDSIRDNTFSVFPDSIGDKTFSVFPDSIGDNAFY